MRVVSNALYQAIRFSGLYHERSAVSPDYMVKVGREVGRHMNCRTLRELVNQCEGLGLGALEVHHWDATGMTLELRNCSCDGLPPVDRCVCDFEAAVLEGALAGLLSKTPGDEIVVKEVRCSLSGHSICQFEAHFVETP